VDDVYIRSNLHAELDTQCGLVLGEVAFMILL